MTNPSTSKLESHHFCFIRIFLLGMGRRAVESSSEVFLNTHRIQNPSMKQFLFVLSFVLIIAGCGENTVTPPVDDPEEEEILVPDCGWQVKSNIAFANWALPNTGTVYWIYAYQLARGEHIRIDGQFPGAVIDGKMQWTRFFNLQTYVVKDLPASGAFPMVPAGASVSGLNDADIVPMAGSANPYVRNANPINGQVGPPGRWSVVVRADADPSTLLTVNEMAAYPRPAGQKPYGTRGALILRYYLPVDGFPLEANAPGKGGVDLPTITRVDAVGKETLVPQCSDVIRQVAASRTLPSKIEIPPIGYQENGPAFVRSQISVFAFLNSANRYLYAEASYDSTRADRMIRIRGKLPRTPKTMQAPYDIRTGDVVAPGATGYDMRYWSFVVNKDKYPYPAVLGGGVQDADIKLDANGTYTIIVSKVEDRPLWWNDPKDGRNALINWLNWTDNDNIGRVETIGLVLRNLDPSETFNQSVDNVVRGSSPQEAHAVMGDYYPVVDWVDGTAL